MRSRRRFLFGIAAIPSLAFGQTPVDAIGSIERQVFHGINVQREGAGLEAVAWSDALSRTARQHSQRMLEAGFFGHEDPRWGDLPTRLTSAGVPWMRCGENVFRESRFPDAAALAVVAWMYSEGHRRNLLTPEFTLSGVGVALGPNETVAVTQQFMVPRAGERERQKFRYSR
jgi:uncharacterized protein YkwD